MVVIAYRFHIDPRAVDEWTVWEFDRFARQCDAFEKHEAEAERKSRSTRSRSR